MATLGPLKGYERFRNLTRVMVLAMDLSLLGFVMVRITPTI